ncbi:hypothetical protein [Sinomonas humi]|uniref:Uncharacterized protein n=1 Tax=Sinomonas humi TaxID=1338436 RepID=A0A0B2AA43_9MICC|nr:hypothetical protein [Sinomonas humi]KHL00434.1 hypothetical protein LK10_19680 [Sinomonas humi]
MSGSVGDDFRAKLAKGMSDLEDLEKMAREPRGPATKWKWDRGDGGSLAPGPQLFEAVDRWGKLADDLRELNRMSREDRWIQFVSRHTVAAFGRTNRIPIKCGTTEKDWSVAFAVRDGAVELIYVDRSRKKDGEYRLTGPGTHLEPVKVSCLCNIPEGSNATSVALRNVSVLSLYRAAVNALIEGGGRDTRKGVQLHLLT